MLAFQLGPKGVLALLALSLNQRAHHECSSGLSRATHPSIRTHLIIPCTALTLFRPSLGLDSFRTFSAQMDVEFCLGLADCNLGLWSKANLPSFPLSYIVKVRYSYLISMTWYGHINLVKYRSRYILSVYPRSLWPRTQPSLPLFLACCICRES